MSKIHSNSKTKPRIFEKRSSSLNKNSQLLQPVNETSKLLSKNLTMYLSPYSRSRLQQSFEKHLDQSVSKPPKEKLPFTQGSQKKIYLLSSLLEEEHSPAPNNTKLSKKLLKKLENLFESVEYIDVYLDILDEVILHDRVFAKVLKMLKNRIKSIFETQQQQVQVLSKNFKAIQDLNDSLETEIAHLSIESQSIKSKLNDVYAKYTEISDKYIKLTKISVDSYEFTEENFKKAKQESVLYKDLIYKLEDELKFFKRKSKRFSRLLSFLEEKGVPVEEIYVTEMKKEKKMPKYLGTSDLESCTDNENIVSGREELDKKPSEVPSLNLLDVGPDSSSSASSFLEQV